MKVSNYRNFELDKVLNLIAQYTEIKSSKHLLENHQVIFDYDLAYKLRELTKEYQILLRNNINFNFVMYSDSFDLLERVRIKDQLSLHELNLIFTDLKLVKDIQEKIKGQKLNQLKIYLSDLQFLHKEYQAIDKLIDSFGKLKYTASTKLKALSDKAHDLSNEIQDFLRHFINNNSDKLMEKVIYTRDERYCVLMLAMYKNKYQGLVHGFSSSGQAVYFEPMKLVELNNNLALIQEDIRVEVQTLIKKIIDSLAENHHILLTNHHLILNLDMIKAKAQYSLDINACFGEFNLADKRFYFKNLKNPLIDDSKVVANTYDLYNYQSIVISGPNTGGKSVSLKSICQSICLGMIGVGIKADQALFPIYDQIFVDIGDEQSIESSLSTFSSHITKIINFIKYSTNKSLIVMDELGSGSDPMLSQALAIAILDHLLQKDATVLISTHFDLVKDFALNHSQVLSSSMQFDEENLKPTYKYLEQSAGSSRALEIMSILGMPSSIIAQSEEILSSQQAYNLFKNVENLQAQLLEEKELQEQEYHKKLTELEVDYQAKLKLLDQKRLELNNKIEEVTNESLVLLKSMEAPKFNSSAVKSKIDKLAESRVENYQDQVLKIGDKVIYLVNNYHGIVEKIVGDKVWISVNNLSMQVKKNQLKLSPTTLNVKKHKVDSLKVRSFNPSLNVIGLYGDEALAICDKFIDNALLHRIKNIEIIHGVGTGALRNKIHQFLKKNKLVKSFNLSNRSGGMGVTEVVLK